MDAGFKLEDYMKPRTSAQLTALEAVQVGPELLSRLINGHSKTHFDYTRCQCGACFSVLENSRGILESVETLLGISIDIHGEQASLAAYKAEAERLIGLIQSQDSHTGPL